MGFGGLHIDIQYPVRVFRRVLPVHVLQEYPGPFEQPYRRGIHRSGRRGLRLRRRRFFPALLRMNDLLNAPDQILDKADLAHVLALQIAQLFRKIIGIHIPVAGNQQPLPVGFHQRQIPAPFVLHPDCAEVFRLCTDHQHDLRAVQRREDIGFVLPAQLILQGDPGEEHLIACVDQLIIDLLGQRAVLRPAAAFIRLLVADEDVIRFFLRGNRQDPFLDLRDPFRFLLVQIPGIGIRGIAQGCLIILIRKDGGYLNPMARGNPFMAYRILHILNAVFAQHHTPVGFRIAVILFQNLFIGGDGLVKLALPPEVICPVKPVQPLFIIPLGDRGRTPAVLALTIGISRIKLNISPAHPALDNHVLAPPFIQAFPDPIHPQDRFLFFIRSGFFQQHRISGLLLLGNIQKIHCFLHTAVHLFHDCPDV